MTRPLLYLAHAWMVEEFGLERAVILNQIIWHQSKVTNDEEHEFEGKHWFYHKYSAWEEEFFFLSRRAIERHIAFFRDAGILLVRKDSSFNRQNYYHLNVDALPKLKQQMEINSGSSTTTKRRNATRQSGGMEAVDLADCDHANLADSTNKNTSKTSNPNTISVTSSSKPTPKAKAASKPKSETPILNHPLWQLYTTLIKGLYDCEPAPPDGKESGQCAQFAKRFKEDAQPLLQWAFEGYQFFDTRFEKLKYEYLGKKLGDSRHSWSVIAFNATKLWNDWQRNLKVQEYERQEQKPFNLQAHL